MLINLETLRLKKGSHEANETEMCVMEAVSFIAGELWSDSPQCASPVIAALLRSYNDSVNDDVRQTLKQYIPRLVGTRGSDAVEVRRSLVAADWLVRTHTPAWLRLAGLTIQAEALESLPEITSMAQVPSIKGPIQAARESADAAWAAAGDAARDAARAAAWDAAGDAARDAARAAAWDAAWAAAGDAARDAARDAAGDAAWDAAWAAAWDAAWAAAGAAAGDAARDAAWAAAGDAAWDAARDAARAAAWDAAWAAAGAAAGDALKPTVEALQATIPTLIERMLSVEVDDDEA